MTDNVLKIDQTSITNLGNAIGRAIAQNMGTVSKTAPTITPAHAHKETVKINTPAPVVATKTAPSVSAGKAVNMADFFSDKTLGLVKDPMVRSVISSKLKQYEASTALAQTAASKAGTASASAGGMGNSVLGALSEAGRGLGMFSAYGAAASAAYYLADTTLGLSSIPKAFSNYFNPEVYSAPTTQGDAGINNYINGLYATAMVVNCPTKEDLIKIDNFLTWRGIPVEEIAVPMIYTQGDYKIVNHGKKHIKVKNSYGFNYIQCEGAVVMCPNAFAKAQFEQMLNNGTRFWSMDNGPVNPNQTGAK